eukprot:6204132-Pleurochrysis_carterae.AAC.1
MATMPRRARSAASYSGEELPPSRKAPPWIKTITGRRPCIRGVQMLRVRQSSLCLPVLPSIVDAACKQSAPNLVASRSPFQRSGSTGGRKRRSPRGGDAYGMPRNEQTPSLPVPRSIPSSISCVQLDMLPPVSNSRHLQSTLALQQ